MKVEVNHGRMSEFFILCKKKSHDTRDFFKMHIIVGGDLLDWRLIVLN